MNLAEQITVNILETLSTHLNEKEIDYSVDDLLNILKTVPQKPKVTPNRAPTSSSKTCIYTPSKGKNTGIPCGKACVVDQDYCRTCMNKEVVKKKLRTTSIVEERKVSPQKENKLTMEPIPDLPPGHYYIPSLHFIVRKDKPSETYIVLGVGEKKVERPLTEEEKEEALSKNLRVLDEVDD